MKKLLMIVFLWFLMITACQANHEISISPTWVATQNAQDEYSKALNRWQSHQISNYEITVEIFSSVAAPPCSTKVILNVQDHNLIAMTELETPMPIQLPDKSLIYNPECHEYENYLVDIQFEEVKKLLMGKLSNGTLSVNWKVKFDTEYGYISELLYGVTGSESIRVVSYSNFIQK